MKVELIGAQGRMSLGAEVWAMALGLGHLYGWAPAGTQRPTPEHAQAIDPMLMEGWDGRYAESHGQQIRALDALNLAGALQRALADLPEAEAAAEPGEDTGASLSPLDYFAGRRKRLVEEIAAICRGGAVVIK